jgi:hypothetical protein
VVRIGVERKVCKGLVGKPEGKSSLGRPRRRWDDGIRMILVGLAVGVCSRFKLAQDRYRWRSVVNLPVLAARS